MAIEQNKAAARRLRSRLADLGVSINHAHSLEGVAAVKGARNWQTLSAEKPESDSASLIRGLTVESDYDLYLDPDDIEYAERGDEATWFILKEPLGSASLCVVGDHRPGKVHYEGDVIRVDCPAKMLDLLPKVSNDSEESLRVLQWRYSAYRFNQRNAEAEAGELQVGRPYYGVFVPGGGHAIGVLVNDSKKEWEITDGEKVERVPVIPEHTFALSPCSGDLENLLSVTAYTQYSGSSHTVIKVLGDPQFKCCVKLTSLGGLVGYCGIPWHIPMSIMNSEVLAVSFKDAISRVNHEDLFPKFDGDDDA